MDGCLQNFLFQRNIRNEGINIFRKHPDVQEGLHGKFNIYICFKTMVKNFGFIFGVAV